MGKASRAKRERREQNGFAAGLTNCEGSWLEHAPQAAELARIAWSRRELSREGAEAERRSAAAEEVIS